MRVPKWQEILIDALNVELAKPFSWQSATCLDLMYCCVRSVLGRHPILQINHHGATQVEVMTWFVDRGFKDLDVLFGKYFPVVPWGWAQDGDVGIYVVGDVQVGCAIVDGVAKTKTSNGRIHDVPVDKLTYVYKVE